MRRRVFWTERKRGERAIERITKRKRKKKKIRPEAVDYSIPVLSKNTKENCDVEDQQYFLT